MKILITGATGFIGNKLVEQLLLANHEIVVLTRNIKNAQKILGPQISYYEWKDTGILPPTDAFIGINGIINLMGENIVAKRWTEEQKKILRDSRVLATKNLVKNIIDVPLDFFIQSSAIGIYPVNLQQTLDEDSKSGNTFLSRLCSDWEKSCDDLLKTKRKIIIRTGIVLHPSGGALKKMLMPFLWCLGGVISNGKQFMSWIHRDDHINIILEAVHNSNYVGIINAVAPTPVTNEEFTKALGHALHRPTVLRIPAFIFKLLLGEMATLMLDSQNIASKRLKELQFQFERKTIEDAFSDLTK